MGGLRFGSEGSCQSMDAWPGDPMGVFCEEDADTNRRPMFEMHTCLPLRIPTSPVGEFGGASTGGQ